MISQGAGYAAVALARIAAAGGAPVLIKDVASACDIPAAYLAKIINTLARKGFVATQRGIGGGVTLARAANEVTLLDLCTALDDPITMPRCMLGTAVCSDARACPAHAFWTAHREKQLAFLFNTTVADIAAFELQKRWNDARPAADAPPVTASLTKPAH